MAYIKETISVYGDRKSFATALRDFFTNNEVLAFELISDETTKDVPSFIIQHNNLKLSISIGASSYGTGFGVSTKINEDTYSSKTEYKISHIDNDSSTDTVAYRALKILLIKNEDAIVLQVAAYNSVSVERGLTIIDTELSNGSNIIGSATYSSNNTAIAFKETTTQLTYTPRPFHIGSNVENALILSNTLAVNNNSGVYYANANGLISAGGAKQFNCYVTGLNKYYGLLENVCISMGDKLEYLSDDLTEYMT
ncbi:MAG: hypothetical protein UHK60_08200 [Acutalibacteraceae bacterium]|nr:hypothetical protein [Acutalibacteraceae bacterium]